MTDDANDPAPEPATCTFTLDELSVPESVIENLKGCSWRIWPEADASRCVWHAEDADKCSEDLADAVGDGELSGARVQGIDLTDVPFPEGSKLVDADLSGANLRGVDPAGAILLAADLTNANLQGADLENALLAGTKLADVSLSRDTIIDDPADRITEADLDLSRSGIYDAVARANHELRAAYSNNGLTGRARRARVQERAARRKEARAEDSWRGTVASGWSLLSKVVTGYGVQLRGPVAMMLLLYFGSAWVYSWQGMTLDRALYYSAITFTTSPPKEPPLGIASVVAGFETFAGTAAIVLLGYVLATREQV